jgi:hypothetical protein
MDTHGTNIKKGKPFFFCFSPAGAALSISTEGRLRKSWGTSSRQNIKIEHEKWWPDNQIKLKGPCPAADLMFHMAGSRVQTKSSVWAETIDCRVSHPTRNRCNVRYWTWFTNIYEVQLLFYLFYLISLVELSVIHGGMLYGRCVRGSVHTCPGLLS